MTCDKEQLIKEVVQCVLDKLDLEKVCNPTPKRERVWKPEIGTEYYFINSLKKICLGKWSGEYFDLYRLASKNVFRTEEDAQAVIDINMRIYELDKDWDGANACTFWYDCFITNAWEPLNESRSYDECTHMQRSTVETIIKEFSADQIGLWAGTHR